MSRHWAMTLTAISALVAGCATENTLQTQPPQTTSTSTPTTASTPTSKAQPATLTGACPLLSNDDLTRLLNNGKDSKLTPTEGTARDSDDGKIYRCAYNRGSTTALELIAREFPADNGRTAATAIDSMSKASKSKTTPISGVGEAAVFHPTSDGTGVLLAAAKVSGGKVRLIALTGPKILPQDKLTDVATVIMERL